MTGTYAARVTKAKVPTRDRILDAALELFIERGVAGTTVSDIERAVGLAAGTGSFYRHYKSKEEVVVPAFRRGVTQLLAQLEAARVADTAVEDAHERDSRDYRALLGEMRALHPLWLLMLSERDQYPQLHDVFIDALGIRTWDLEWDQDWIRTIAIAALTGFHQLSMLDEAYYGTIDPETYIARLTELTEMTEMTERMRAERR
jgi:AcrR family transcriptional regulator